MDPTLERGLLGRIGVRLDELGFQTDVGTRRVWAARRTARLWGIFGWQTVVYCLSCVVDERSKAVRFADAVLQRKHGLIPRRVPASGGYAEVRPALEQLTRDAGWSFRYGSGRDAAAPPRLFEA